MKRIRISKQKLDQIFEEYQNSADLLIALHKMLFPAWEYIESLEHWPTCSKSFSDRACRRIMDLDKKNGHNFPGAIWLNNGFSVLEAEKYNLKENEFIIYPELVKMKPSDTDENFEVETSRQITFSHPSP